MVDPSDFFEELLEGEAIDEHQDDDGGNGHAEDSEAEDFLANDFTGEGFQGDRESSGVT